MTNTKTARNARPTICFCCNVRRIDPAISDAVCPACWDEAGEENAHSDGYHADQPSSTCHICLNVDPHASIKARNVEGHSNGGKVADPTTDRRLAANKNLPKRTKSQRAADRKARKLAEAQEAEKAAKKTASRNKVQAPKKSRIVAPRSRK